MTEHRLIGYTLSDFNDPTRYNSRIAQENAAAQAAGREAVLTDPQRLQNTVAIGQALQGGDPNALASAQRGLNYDNQQASQSVQPSTLLKEGQAVYGASPNEQTVYDTRTQQAVNIPDGNIALSAFNRMTGDNNLGVQLSDTDAAKRLNDPSYKSGIRSAMNDVGRTNNSKDIGDRAAAEAEAKLQELIKSGRRVDQTTAMQIISQARENALLEQQNEQKAAEMKEQQKEKMQKYDVKSEETKKKFDELESLMNTLSPEIKAAVGYEISVMKRQAEGIDADTKKMLGTFQTDAQIEGQYKTLEDFTTKADEQYKALADKNLETMKKIAEYNRDMLEIDKKIMEQKAAEDEAKQIKANVQNERKLRRQLNALGIETDVRGLDYLTESIQEGQDALASLRSGNSLNSLKANLAIGEGYRLDVQKALDAHEGSYLEITNQTAERLASITNSIAQAKSDKQKEIRATLKWGAEQKNELELQTAKTVTNANYKMMEEQNRVRDDQRAQEQQGWQRLQWAVQTYGTNAPPALLDSIGKQLPGVDVRSTASQMTLAEMKKKGAGGGGGGLSGFSPHLMKPGNQPPSFDDFLIEKEKQALANGATSFDTGTKAMAAYRKEYDARLSSQNKLNPNDIINRFKMKAGTMTGPQRKAAERDLSDYIASGQYDLASDLVDNSGDDIPATQSNDFTQALNARYDIQKMANLVDEFGTMGPVTGRVRQLNPYDDQAVRFQNLITQAVPNLARGIFKEVGVLTDDDVKRYMGTIGNPNLTVGQAQQAFKDLQEKIDVSMHNQIDVWNANGKRVKGFRDLYESSPVNASEAAPTSDADEEFARSILAQ